MAKNFGEDIFDECYFVNDVKCSSRVSPAQYAMIVIIL